MEDLILKNVPVATFLVTFQALIDDVAIEMVACSRWDWDRADSSYCLDSFLAHFSGHLREIDLVAQPLRTVRRVMIVVTLMKGTIRVSLLLVALTKSVILAYYFDSYSAHASTAFGAVVTDLVELKFINKHPVIS